MSDPSIIPNVPKNIIVKATREQIALIKTNAPNFSPEELMCRCCGELDMKVELLTSIQALRNYIKVPLVRTSAYRCEKHNIAVGGKPHSMHLTGQAIDISLNFLRKTKVDDRERLHHKFIQMAMHLFNGIGLATTFIHLDVRKNKALWHY